MFSRQLLPNRLANDLVEVVVGEWPEVRNEAPLEASLGLLSFEQSRGPFWSPPVRRTLQIASWARRWFLLRYSKSWRTKGGASLNKIHQSLH